MQWFGKLASASRLLNGFTRKRGARADFPHSVEQTQISAPSEGGWAYCGDPNFTRGLAPLRQPNFQLLSQSIEMIQPTLSSLYVASLLLQFGAASRVDAQANAAAPRYDLMVDITPDAHRLSVRGTLTIAPTIEPRSEIRLSLGESLHGLKVEIVEPVASAGVAETLIRDSTSRNIKWIIRPTNPIPAGETVTLRFSYSGGETLTNQFYVGPEVSFASAWGTDWYPLLDSKNDKSVGTIRFSVAPGQTVYATGLRRSLTQEEANGRFTFEIVHPTYFAFASGQYSVARSTSPVPIAIYSLHARGNTDRELEAISRILGVLTQEFGAYPFPEFAVIEVPRALAQRAGFNAAGVQGFILVNSGALDAPDSKYVLNFFGHEFSHQWFPNEVALVTPPGLYMEEALAEYGGLQVVEALAGAAAGERYRRTGFEYDPGYSALQYFKLVGTGVDQPLSDLKPKLEHRNLAYSKGFLVLDMLSRQVGKKKFQTTLAAMTKRYAFQEITWLEFLRAVEAGSGQNLKWFYDQWFNRTGAPEFHLVWKQLGSRLSGSITQGSPYYRSRLELAITNDSGRRVVRTVQVQGPATTFSFRMTFRADSVELDPNYLVLRWTPEFQKAASEARSSPN